MLSGGEGNDFLDGGAGDDTVYGDAGDDMLVGGLGSADRAIFSAGSGLVIRLDSTGSGTATGQGNDILRGFEIIETGDFGDLIEIGSDADNFANTVLVLLCHKLCVATGTSWEPSYESADEFSPDGGDRLSDVAFGANGRSRAAGRRSTGGTLCRLCGG
jgi:hypothetical protein